MAASPAGTQRSRGRRRGSRAAAAAGGRERGGTKVRKPGDKHSTKVRTSRGRPADGALPQMNTPAPRRGRSSRGGGGKEVSGGMSPGVSSASPPGVIIIIAVAAFALMGKRNGGGHSRSSGSSEKEAAAPVRRRKGRPEARAVSRPEPPTDSGYVQSRAPDGRRRGQGCPRHEGQSDRGARPMRRW